MQGNAFSIDHVSKVTINCTAVNKPTGSSYIKSSNWLKFENDRSFPYDFTLTQHHTEIKNHPEQESNIKLFQDLYKSDDIKY